MARTAAVAVAVISVAVGVAVAAVVAVAVRVAAAGEGFLTGWLINLIDPLLGPPPHSGDFSEELHKDLYKKRRGWRGLEKREKELWPKPPQ